MWAIVAGGGLSNGCSTVIHSERQVGFDGFEAEEGSVNLMKVLLLAGRPEMAAPTPFLSGSQFFEALLKN